MLQQATALTDADITALSHSIACVLRSGRVTEQQALVLRSALGGLQFCSVGVYVQEFGTVITTDCLLTPGFFDLSLCPTRSAMAGCVVSQGKAFHDNTSVLRSGFPVDIAHAVQRYSIKSAVCVPVRLTAVVSEGDVLASERILGTLTLASCHLDAVTSQHRSTAESLAAALAPSFADATTSIYNNITDYVLGPMHGRPYPVALEPRPHPSDSQTPPDGCWHDDSDSEPEDPGTSQLLPVTDAGGTMDSAAPELSAFGSLRIDVDPNSQQAAPSQHPAAVLVEQQQQEPLNDSPRARHSLERVTPPGLCDRPSSQRGGASAPQSEGQQQGPHHARQRNSALSTAQRHTRDRLSDLRRQFSLDDKSRSSFGFTLPLFWIKPKRSRSDDSAHESDVPGKQKHMTKGSHEDARKAEAFGQWPVQATSHSSYKQHKFLLQFCDNKVEKQFCLWQAQQRTKVQLLYSIAVITVMLSVHYVTPNSQRGVVLWLPPLLQLLPAVALLFNPAWYMERSESLYVMLNMVKAVWSVWVGTPRPATFWPPGRRLAVWWKFGLDTLMVSGLGELFRFSTFFWVQALDLGILTARSGALCALPESVFQSTQRCMVAVLGSHFVITYLLAGGAIWYMDMQARSSFVQHAQHAVSVAS